MARISTYINDTFVTLRDRWIGTDADNVNATKNFTAQAVADLFNASGAIGILGQNNFVFQTVINTGRLPGSISFDGFGGDGTNFSALTTIKISKYASTTKLILDYLETLVDQYIIIARVDDPNNFGVYKLDALVQDIDEPDFYDATFSLEVAHGALESDEYYGIAIYPGPVGTIGDKNYVHTQSVAASTWTVNHNLGKYASATMVLSTGQKGYGDITYIDDNTLTITFASAESGKAYIN